MTILRPIETDPSQRWSALGASLQSNGKGDVWVQLAADKPLADITGGASDKSGWFSPQWSPDGMHLAMLSTRGGQLRLWTWSRLTGRLRPVSGAEVAFGSTQPEAVDLEQPYVWLDSREILCTVVPENRRWQQLRSMYEYPDDSQTPSIAMAAWRRYLSGAQSTASVLDDLKASGPLPGADLVLVNLDGREKILAHNVNTLLWQASPARDAVAFTRQVKVITKPTNYLYPLASRGDWRLTVVTTDGRQIVTTGDEAREVIPRSIRWSPEGGGLAYLGYASKLQIAPSIYLLDMRTDRVSAIQLKSLNVSPWGRRHHPIPAEGGFPPLGLHWTNAGGFLVRGTRMAASAEDNVVSGAREDWWLISREGAERCLTCRLSSAPISLWPERGREQFFGLAGGHLWEFNLSSGTVADLTRELHGTVTELISPVGQAGVFYSYNRTVVSDTNAEAIFQLKDSRSIKLHILDLQSHVITNLMPPSEGASVMSLPGGKSILYLKNDRTGLYLWRGSVHSGVSKLLFSANAFLNGIAEGRILHFPYTSLDGTKLNAWILLPPGYSSGRRYPMITYIYPTTSFSAPDIPLQMKFEDGISSEFFLNMQIAAAHGYAVLFPSIPVSYDDRDKVRLKVVNDVLPAVAAAVRRGFGDPHRLAIWGHSYGGEAVMDLITRTNRFQAAIASSGASDQISAYGTLNAQARYAKWAEENVHLQYIIEGGELNLGGPPWRDWLKYIRNSPIFFVNRVQTPLLLTDGDLDFVPIQQSEEFFSALVRQGKPVRFVRFWGEGHLLTNPANIRDYWQEVFRWLQLYLPAEGKK